MVRRGRWRSRFFLAVLGAFAIAVFVPFFAILVSITVLVTLSVPVAVLVAAAPLAVSVLALLRL